MTKKLAYKILFMKTNFFMNFFLHESCFVLKEKKIGKNCQANKFCHEKKSGNEEKNGHEEICFL